MRKVVVLFVAVVACLLPGLTAVSATAPHESDQARLHALCRRDLAVVRRHGGHAERPAHRPAVRRRAHRRADLHDQHRRLPVECRRRREARHHRAPRAADPALRDGHHAGGHGAARARRPVLQLVRPPRRRQAHHLAPDRGAARPDPVVGRQRVAGHRAADRAQRRTRAGRARRRDLRLDGLRLLLRPGQEPDPLPLLAGEGHRPVLLRHRGVREPHRGLHRDRQG